MQTELHYQLRQLKLSGVLESLDHRILECQQNDIDYKGFLSLLCIRAVNYPLLLCQR
jgi:hypothetical protein